MIEMNQALYLTRSFVRPSQLLECTIFKITGHSSFSLQFTFNGFPWINSLPVIRILSYQVTPSKSDASIWHQWSEKLCT